MVYVEVAQMTKIILDISPDLLDWYEADAKRNETTFEMSIVKVLRKNKEYFDELDSVTDEDVKRFERAHPWIKDGLCQMELYGEKYICDLGFACDGCPYNPSSGTGAVTQIINATQKHMKDNDKKVKE